MRKISRGFRCFGCILRRGKREDTTGAKDVLEVGETVKANDKSMWAKDRPVWAMMGPPGEGIHLRFPRGVVKVPTIELTNGKTRIRGVICDVKKEVSRCRASRRDGNHGCRRSFKSRSSTQENTTKQRSSVAATSKAKEETGKERHIVRRVRAEALETVKVTAHKARKEAWGMTRRWRYVQEEVEFFLVHGGMDCTVVAERDNHVKEDNRPRGLAAFPFKVPETVDASLELFIGQISRRARGYKDIERIVNIPNVVFQTKELGNHYPFVYIVIQSGVHRCRRCTHGSTRELEKVSSVKFEDGMAHDEFKSFDDCRDVNTTCIVESGALEKVTNDCQCMGSFYVGIHGNSIHSEEERAGREATTPKVRRNLSRAGSHILKCSNDSLKLDVKPFTQRFKYTTGVGRDRAARPWALMNFSNYVELAKRKSWAVSRLRSRRYGKTVENVFTNLGKTTGGTSERGDCLREEEVYKCTDKPVNGLETIADCSQRHLAIRGDIVKMSIGLGAIGIKSREDRTKIFVRGPDEVLRVLAEEGKAFTLRGQEVQRNPM